MRLEIERQDLRKKEGDAVRQLELACIFTLCGMKPEHKFLAYKSAFMLNYKAGNFITASHFARQVIDLESTGVSKSNLNAAFALKEAIPYLYNRYIVTNNLFVPIFI